ncbi:MAG TPA: TadE/TadG family type IV pilus assembly protein [Allosphingosinicella sp.]|jgi:Flp pilus assembly protein TadG
MATAILSRLRSLRDDERGVSLLEFTAMAPMLGLLIVAVADIGRGYTERFALQQAANRTLELAHSGTKTNDYSFLATHAQTAAGTDATVTLTQWLECTATNGTRTTKTMGSTCSAGEETGRYVTLNIAKPFDPVFTTMGYPTEADGSIKLKARASLRVQ